MNVVVLDFEFLSANLEVLRRNSVTTQMVVPAAVMAALQQRRQVDKKSGFVVAVIEKAQEAGALRMGSTPVERIDLPVSLPSPTKEVLITALEERDKSNNAVVWIATTTDKLIHAAVGQGIKTLNAKNLEALLGQDGVGIVGLESALAARARRDLFGHIISGGAGSIITVICVGLIQNPKAALGIIDSPWGAAVGVLLIAWGLCFMRSTRLMPYALVEICVGCWTATKPFPSVPSAAEVSSTLVLTVLGGTYVVVRGLINLREALSAAPNPEWLRRILFPWDSWN